MEEENPRKLRGYLEKAMDLPIIGPIISNDYVQIGAGVGGALALNFLLGDPIGLKSEEMPRQEYRAEATNSEAPTLTQPKYEIEEPNRFKNATPVDNPNAPVFPGLVERAENGEYLCATYARLSAKHRHKKQFYWANAWDRRGKDKLVATLENPLEELREMAENGELQPGMILGVKYPGSRFQNESRPYTHNMMYRGVKDDKMVAAHMVGTKQEDINISDAIEKGIIPVDVFDSSLPDFR